MNCPTEVHFINVNKVNSFYSFSAAFMVLICTVKLIEKLIDRLTKLIEYNTYDLDLLALCYKRK